MQVETYGRIQQASYRVYKDVCVYKYIYIYIYIYIYTHTHIYIYIINRIKFHIAVGKI